MRIIKLCVTMLVVGMLWGIAAAQSQETPTLEPTPPPLFIGNPCAEPCFFGITAGQSTSADVVQAIEVEQTNYFFAAGFRDVGNVVENESQYYFRFRTWERSYGRQLGSGIVLTQDVIDFMRIRMNRDATLHETFEILGNPDEARMVSGLGVERIILIYLDELMRIVLIAPDDCQIADAGEVFLVEWVDYYSYERATALVGSFPDGIEIPQPDILAYSGSGERHVPPETFTAWLNGEVDLSCREARHNLAGAASLPAILPLDTRD